MKAPNANVVTCLDITFLVLPYYSPTPETQHAIHKNCVNCENISAVEPSRERHFLDS